MSSFFRSAADISSSREDDTTTSNDDTTDQSNGDYSIARIQTLGSSNAGDASESGVHEAFTEGSRKSSYHRDLLLHALLEERCINEAFDDLKASGVRADSKNHPEVRALAKEKYSNLCQKLGSYGLVTGDLDSDQLGGLRQTYRDGISLLTRTSANVQPPIEDMLDQTTIPGPLLRLLNGTSATDDLDRRFSTLSVASPNVNQPKLMGGILPGHPLLQSTRYSRDFEEFGILGKGGYGTVFRAKHNLDGRHYAVKKIPLGPTRMRRIQTNGQAELDSILVEIRTLARLEHPNIVRYHSGWIEWAPLMVPARRAIEVNGRKLLEAPTEFSEDETSGSLGPTTSGAPAIDVQFGYDDEDDLDISLQRDSQQRFATQEEQNILFEDSSRMTNKTASDTQSLQPGSYSDGGPLQKIPSRSTVASVSDESEVEVITRRDDPTTSFDSSLTGSQSHPSEPSLALHIQMSLYSMTLSDFLAPSPGASGSDSAAIASLRHCFHPQSSLEILSSIIEGVEYLHSEGIVHRDLKPGNIFLGVRPGSKCPPGAIALSSCNRCHAAGLTRPFNASICIGDFGLVSAIARPEDADDERSASCKAVGTEIYRPETVTRDNHPSLDVFALGIIAFELFCRFGTRMERHETLRRLKRAQFPSNFERDVECEGLKEWIEGMVSACEANCPTWDDLRAPLVEMLRTCTKEA